MPVSNVYNMDCNVGMKEFPDKFFELAICDPEYGIDIANRNGSIGQKRGQGKITKYKRKLWDIKPASAEYFKELFRVSKNQIIWGGNYFTPHLPASKCWVVYDKHQPQGVTFAMAELAYTSFDMSVKTFKCPRSEMQNCVSNNERIGLQNAKIHPAQKPSSLYRWLIRTFAQTGDKILDTHLGSQNSRIAAYKLGFDFYGYEIDQEIYNQGCENFEKSIAEPLFDQIKTEQGKLL